MDIFGFMSWLFEFLAGLVGMRYLKTNGLDEFLIPKNVLKSHVSRRAGQFITTSGEVIPKVKSKGLISLPKWPKHLGSGVII